MDRQFTVVGSVTDDKGLALRKTLMVNIKKDVLGTTISVSNGKETYTIPFAPVEAFMKLEAGSSKR